MKEKLKELAFGAVAVAFGIGLIIVALFLIRGGAWLAERVQPYTAAANVWAFYACFFVLFPATVFRRLRVFSGFGLFLAATVFAFSLWLTSLVVTYQEWGTWVTFVGLFFGGFGVIPIALGTALWERDWTAFSYLLTLLVAAVAGYFMGGTLLAEYDAEQKKQRAEPTLESS